MHFQAFPRAQIFLSEAINEISIVRNSATASLQGSPPKFSVVCFAKSALLAHVNKRTASGAARVFFFQIIIKQAKSKQKRMI